MGKIKGWKKHNNLVYFNEKYVGGIAVESMSFNSDSYVVREYKNGKIVNESKSFSRVEPAREYMINYMKSHPRGNI